MGRRVFINHRTSDTEAIADRLASDLTRRLGKNRVFFDRRSIKPGKIWPSEIQDQLARADIVLVLIGPSWESALEAAPQADDWARLEISQALRAQATEVWPVYFERDALRREAKLPHDLAGLLDRQGMWLWNQDWDMHVEALVQRIEEHHPVRHGLILSLMLMVMNLLLVAGGSAMAWRQDQGWAFLGAIAGVLAGVALWCLRRKRFAKRFIWPIVTATAVIFAGSVFLRWPVALGSMPITNEAPRASSASLLFKQVTAGQTKEVSPQDMATDSRHAGALRFAQVVHGKSGASATRRGSTSIVGGRGTLRIAADGSLIAYEAAQQPLSGSDVFTCTIEDASGASVGVDIEFKVQSSHNTAPIGKEVRAYCPPGRSVAISANDAFTDPDEVPVIISCSAPSSGAEVKKDPDRHAVLYTANEGFSGIDTFEITANDRMGLEATATIRIKVPPREPVPIEDSFDVAMDGSRDIVLVPPELQAHFSAVHTNPERGPHHGTLSQVGAAPQAEGPVGNAEAFRPLRYTPNPKYHGPDSFSYIFIDCFSRQPVALRKHQVSIIVTPPR